MMHNIINIISKPFYSSQGEIEKNRNKVDQAVLHFLPQVFVIIRNTLLKNPHFEMDATLVGELEEYFSDERILTIAEVALQYLKYSITNHFASTDLLSVFEEEHALGMYLQRSTGYCCKEVKAILYSDAYVQNLDIRLQAETLFPPFFYKKPILPHNIRAVFINIEEEVERKERLQEIQNIHRRKLDLAFQEDTSPWKSFEEFAAAMKLLRNEKASSSAPVLTSEK